MEYPLTALEIITTPLPGQEEVTYLDLLKRSFTKPLAYHGLDHCLNVAGRAWAGAVYHGWDPGPLTLAGLFHDANHGGIRGNDQANIARALSIWPGSEEVARLIQATCWPHAKGSSLQEQVIQDADLLETSVNLSLLVHLQEEQGGPPPSASWPLEHLQTSWAKDLAKYFQPQGSRQE